MRLTWNRAVSSSAMTLDEWFKGEKRPRTRLVVVIVGMYYDNLDQINEAKKRGVIQKHVEVIRICALRDIPIIHLERPGYPTIEEIRTELDSVENATTIKTSPDGLVKKGLLPFLPHTHRTNMALLMGLFANAPLKDIGEIMLEQHVDIATSPQVTSNPNSWENGTNPFGRRGYYQEDVIALLAKLGGIDR